MSEAKAPCLKLWCTLVRFAVYAISSLDTSSPLRHRTRQRRRGTPGSCRARSPALLVGGRDRVASCVHVHRTRMLICMHIWGSSLHLPPHRRPSIIVIGARPHALEELVARRCCRQRRRDRVGTGSRRSRVPAPHLKKPVPFFLFPDTLLPQPPFTSKPCTRHHPHETRRRRPPPHPRPNQCQP